ncbi:hypothetical protein QJS10_CPB14g01329 [Acorus calamus]|uniref:Uncharacterized protein n=1 Tax=Acorus calamus TaxID=4465 RepID=A0AAV9DA33_ACOCL|nr:hypothetical protein QJS10_CPB14g01329 [Acorus calamus]
MLLLFIVVIQPAMAARVTIPADAKPEGTSEIADAELNQPACASSRGGSYPNRCFKPINKRPPFTPAPPGSP